MPTPTPTPTHSAVAQQSDQSQGVAGQPARVEVKPVARSETSGADWLSTVSAVAAAIAGLAAVAAVYYYRRQAMAGERQAGVAASQARAARGRRVPRVELQRAPVGGDWTKRFLPSMPFRVPVTVRHVQGDAAPGVVVFIDRFEVFTRDGLLLLSRRGLLAVGLLVPDEIRPVGVPLLPSGPEGAGDPYDLVMSGHVQLDDGRSFPFAFHVNPLDRFATDLVPILGRLDGRRIDQ